MTKKFRVNEDDMNKEYMNTRTFEDSTTSTAKVIGRDHGINVIFAGGDSTAATDSKTILLPANDSTKQMTKKQVVVGRGFVNHEILHKLCTDFNVVKKATADSAAGGSKLLWPTINALEDIRIERCGAEMYPGMPKSIAETSEYVNSVFLDKHYKKDPTIVDDFRRIGPVAMTWEGRRRLGYDTESNEECLSKLPADIRKRVETWVDALWGLPTARLGRDGKWDGEYAKSGTGEVYALAKRLIDELDEEEKEKGSRAADEEGKEGDDGEGGFVKGGRSLEVHELGDAKEGEGTSKPGPGGRGADGTLTTLEGGAGHEEYEREVEPFDPGLEMAKELFAKGAGKGAVGWRPISRQGDRVHTIKDDKNKYPGTERGWHVLHDKNNRPVYEKCRKRLSSKTGVMRRKMERVILSQERRDFEAGQRSGKFDHKRMVQAHQLEPGVYRKKVEGTDVNTAVQIVIDLSGSMHGYPVSLAQQATIALAEALQGTGCALEVVGFNASDHHDKTINKAISTRGAEKFSRYEAIDIYVFKAFDEPMREAKQGLGGIANASGGNNIDGESVLMCFDRLAKRRETKKIMLVMSDGYPACATGYGTEHLYQHLRDVIEYIAKQGVKLVGIGMASEAVKQFYPRYTVLNDISELTKSVLDHMGKLIISERYVADNADLIKTDTRRAKEAGRR